MPLANEEMWQPLKAVSQLTPFKTKIRFPKSIAPNEGVFIAYCPPSVEHTGYFVVDVGSGFEHPIWKWYVAIGDIEALL